MRETPHTNWARGANNKYPMNREKFDPIALSTIGILFPIYSIYWIFNHFTLDSIAVLYVTSWYTAIHVTLFAHRSWAHKSWIPNRAVKLYGLFMFSLLFVGNSLGWVSIHREHHRYTDTEKDPHSPYYKSRLRIHFLSYLNKVKIQYMADLLKDKDHIFFAKYYWHINFILFLILFLIDNTYLSFWIAVLGINIIKMHTINSLGHKTPWFLLPIKNNSTSSNSVILALLNINSGEAWHKNHHEDPKNWKFGKQWYEIDPPSWVISLLVFLKLAKLN